MCVCVCVCIQWPGFGKNVCLLKMTAGCQWLEPWGPADLLSWKMWRHRDGGTDRPGWPMRWCVGRRGAKPARDCHLEDRRTVILLREARKPRGRGVATKLTCPAVLQCNENTSSHFSVTKCEIEPSGKSRKGHLPSCPNGVSVSLDDSLSWANAHHTPLPASFPLRGM